MKKSLYLFISIVLLASVFHACIPNLEYPGTIVGIVTDKATGEPIRSAAVILQPNGIATSTGNNGYYEFTNLKSGGYAVEVSHKEYKEYVSGMIAVAAGEISHVDIQLEKLPPSLRVVNDKVEDIDELDFGDIEDDITRSFNIFNDNGSITLDWEISYTASWIKSVNKEKGVLKVDSTQTIVLTIDRSKLSPGENTTTIHITSNNGSKELKVKAIGKNIPTLDMLQVEVTSKSTAKFVGKILNPGKPEYTVRGFVYSTSSMPTLENTIANVTANINNDSEYSISVTGLSSGTTYYARAYATNNLGTAYSHNEVKFSTDADKLPVLNMLEVNDVTEKSAYFVAEITSPGDPVYTKRGFVYSTSSMPTLETSIANITSPLDNNSRYSAYISSLNKGYTYYVRAYADNGVGVSYSANEVKFSTIAQLTQLTTDDVTDIDVMAETAILNATMSNVGDPKFEKRGFYYGTNPEPTSADYEIVDYGTTAGKYSVKIANLQQSVTYYVRAYAVQNGKYIYGGTKVFSLNKEVSNVTTSAATSIGATTATLNGSVVAVGNPPYSEKGFCYNTSGNPSINHTKITVSGSSVGNYKATINNLGFETTYYYRAYVIQNGTPIYGNVSQFTTIWQNAAVRTLDPVDVKGSSAKLKGQVTYVGDPIYSWQGFCYATHSNPSISDYKVERQNNLGGNYSMDVNNLEPGQTYYVKAFLRQGDKVIYADDVKTLSVTRDPVVITNNATNIKGLDSGLGVSYDYSVQFNGTITDVGEPAYTERGFVYGTTSSVVVGTGTKLVVSGSGKTGDFSTTTTLNVWASSMWYIRAYVKTANGYIYGSPVTVNLL